MLLLLLLPHFGGLAGTSVAGVPSRLNLVGNGRRPVSEGWRFSRSHVLE